MKKIIALLLFCMAAMAHAEIRIIVPFSAGGSFDVIARRLAPFIEAEFGTPTIVQNINGGAGLVAMKTLETSNKYDTLMVTSPAHYMNLVAQNQPLETFKYPAIFGNSPLYLVAAKKHGLTCESFRDTSKKYFFGSSGIGTTGSTAISIINNKYPTITEVPYKTIAQMIPDIMQGTVHATFIHSLTGGFSDTNTYVPIANTTSKKVNGVPSWSECLGINTFMHTQFLLVGHKEASTQFMHRVNNVVFAKFMSSPEVATYFRESGIVTNPADYFVTQRLVQQEFDFWKSRK
jgi:tripartite-type tricarboxylate transporter receptor subunit TctC